MEDNINCIQAYQQVFFVSTFYQEWLALNKECSWGKENHRPLGAYAYKLSVSNNVDTSIIRFKEPT